MAKQKFTNNAISKLAGSLTAVATTLSVTATEGAKFPTLAAGEWFMTTLVKLVGGFPVYEVIKVTARAGDVFTIVRGQEGTIATTFSAGDLAELRPTSGTLDGFAQLVADNTWTGDQTMSAASLFEAEGAAIASAATTDIWAAKDGNTVHITGTTTITSFGTAPQAGAWMKVIFDAALTLTQSANLNLNGGGANIVVAADDMALVYADTTTQMDVFVIRKSGAATVAPPSTAMVLLGTITPSAAANVDFLNVFSSTYDDYLIIADGITVSAADTMRFRFAKVGAADAASAYYTTDINNPTTSAQTFGALNGSAVHNTGAGMSLEILVTNANDTSGRAKRAATRNTHQSDATPTFQSDAKDITYTAANAVTGFRLFWSGGSNFGATGSVKVYGIAKV